MTDGLETQELGLARLMALLQCLFLDTAGRLRGCTWRTIIDGALDSANVSLDLDPDDRDTHSLTLAPGHCLAEPTA